MTAYSREGKTETKLSPSRERAAPDRRYYTTSQLMSRWGVSAPTVIRLIEEGSLTGLKIRGVYRVDRASVAEYERRVAF